MAKPKHKTNWMEMHQPQNALTSEQIQPGGIYRTLRLGRMKEKGKINYQYGVVKLLDDSTTKIDISFNLAITDGWAQNGNINADNGHVSFFPPRPEHVAMIQAKKDEIRLSLEVRKLSAELDFNKAMLDDRCKEIEFLSEAMNTPSMLERIVGKIDSAFAWLYKRLAR